jgi:4-amino-4-deoxy-L-arabinose transferase-like glycosyltransferase
MSASMSVEKVREYLVANWRQVITGFLLVLGVLGALIWQLNSLVPGYSPEEVATYNNSLSLRAILDNPLNAPFLVAVRGLLFIHPDSYLAVRIVSVAAGLITLIVFALLLRHWHSTRTAVIGTFLFGLSAWFLHTARLGTPDVLLFGVFVLAACGFWLKQTNSWLALFACFLGTAALLYVPGMIWFVALGLVWQWKSIDRVFKRHLGVVSAGTVLLLGALAPLGWALYKHTDLIRPYLGLPESWPTPWTMIRNAAEAPFHLFVRNAPDPATWLGTAPIMDVFTLAMFALGAFLYLRKWRLARTPIFLFIFLFTWGMMIIGSPAITFTVVIPFVYITIAGGASYMLQQWFSVFPRNPIARSIGWGLISIVVALSCGYQLTHYFIGWPQTTATHSTFTAQKP